MQGTQHHVLETPDKTRAFPNGRVIAQTNSCETPHFQYTCADAGPSEWTTGTESWPVW